MANDLAQKVGIGLNLGLEKYRGEESYNDNAAWGSAREFYMKYGLSSHVSTIFNYGLVDLDDGGNNFETEVNPYIEMKLQFAAFPQSRITPYVFAGGGILAFTPKDTDGNKIPVSKSDNWGDWKGMALVGAGAEFFINEYVAINGLVDWHLPFTDQLDGLAAGEWDDGYWGAKVGIAVYVGQTDSDGDGIPNSRDADPRRPEDFDDFEDDDGAPELDNDHDGIPDMYDWAANAREDVDNFQDWDGAPDLDNDGDGIMDDRDKAPNEAEDFDGYEDEDGAPDWDNDRDGIVDIYDGAANDPETFNDYMDWDGIPDEACKCSGHEPVKVKTDIMPEKVGEKVILRDVNFEFASAKLTLNSHAILNNVADILKDHMEIELEIQGHTDSVGSDSYNQGLSQKRADSVRNYLIKQGIEKGRLKSIGYGERYPVASNDTEEGQAMNRRVEFLRLK
jgi:outer membrane protein OmpA-like peptidoglycan-associated protein